MKFENTVVYNMLEAIQAARLSYASESDSRRREGDSAIQLDYGQNGPAIGSKDWVLVEKLAAKGPSHRKFMRQILLSVDITAPRYWWTQFDTYKVGVTSCSESTMHTLMKRELALNDFAFAGDDGYYKTLVDYLETLRWSGQFEKLVALLPQSYMQKRHVTMNYEVVRNIREQRKGHKLGEWKEFILWSDSLPRAGLFFGDSNA